LPSTVQQLTAVPSDGVQELIEVIGGRQRVDERDAEYGLLADYRDYLVERKRIRKRRRWSCPDLEITAAPAISHRHG
jgi:hypothetical protein